MDGISKHSTDLRTQVAPFVSKAYLLVLPVVHVSQTTRLIGRRQKNLILACGWCSMHMRDPWPSYGISYAEPDDRFCPLSACQAAANKKSQRRELGAQQVVRCNWQIGLQAAKGGKL